LCIGAPLQALSGLAGHAGLGCREVRTVAHNGSKTVVLAALGGNLAIAVTKLAASLYTGSSAMLTEAIHSFVDTGNQGLLLYGMKRSARPADERHPFGHGLELYFWSFVVALMIFALGGAVSIYEGIRKIRQPEPIESAWINFAVLGASMLFEGISFTVAYREFTSRYVDLPLWSAIRRSKDPSAFAVLLEDSAALVGLVFALMGISASVWLGWPAGDGAASIAIGGLLVLTAGFLANETRSLLTGESASPRVLAAARALLEADPRVIEVRDMLSLQLGPSEVLLAATLDVPGDLSADELGATARELRQRIEAGQPIVSHVFFRLAPPDGGGRHPLV
jgi:cation diffusion facilitator family transporter